MASKIYQQVSKERYDIILGRYTQFQKDLNNPDAVPVRVFDPLSPRQISELELIRAVSQELQVKKEEDVAKAAQQAAAQVEEAKKAAEEAKKAAEEEANKTTEEIKEQNDGEEEKKDEVKKE